MIDMFQDEEFKSLDVEKQKEIATNYFNQELADDEFNSLENTEKQSIMDNFFKTEIGIEEVVEPKEDKATLLDEQYNNAVKVWDNLLKDNKVSQEFYDINLSKMKLTLQEKKDELELTDAKRQKELKDINDSMKTPEQKESPSALDRTMEAAERVNIGLGTFQGQFRQNVLAPLADKLGMDETSAALVLMGKQQVERGEKSQEDFKKEYGEDAWNIAQGVGEYIPDVVQSVYMGAKNVPQAIGEGAVTYSRTGDVGTATIAGLTSLASNTIIGKVFDIGSKKVLTKFGKQIKDLPEDDQINLNKALDALEDLNITSLNAESRKQLLSKMDLTKPTEEITKDIVNELNVLATKSEKAVKDAYDKAKSISRTAGRYNISFKTVRDDIRNAVKGKDISVDKNVTKAISSINKDLKTIVKDIGTRDLSANDIEGILKSLKANQSSAEGAGKSVYAEAINYFQTKQTDLVGDIYSKPRELWKKHQTQFGGDIIDEGIEGGKKVGVALAKDVKFNIGNRLVGDKVDPEIAKDLKNLKLSDNAKKDLVNDVLTRGLDTEDLASRDNVNMIISRWNNSNKAGMKELLGNNYKSFEKQIKGLELIQNTMDSSPIKEGYKRNIINFITNASLMKISPVYAAKGMVYEGKNIATKLAFRKQADAVRSRIKEIPDSKARDKVMRAFNNVMIGFTAKELDAMFNQEDKE